MKWEGDHAAGPHGCTYTLHSEKVHFEPRHWWVVMTRADGTKEDLPQDCYGQSKRQARASAERHARSWQQ